MTNLNVSMVQTAVKFGNPSANIESLKRILDDQVKPFSIIVLPELWTCSYDNENLMTHSESSSEALEFLAGVARNKVSWIIGGSMPVYEKGKMYNRSFIIDDSGTIVGKYDKCHLFPELDRQFSPGTAPLFFNIGEVRCSCVLCYDIRFPEYIRALALAGIEILFVPAAWGALRISHWRTLLQARAIENEIFVLGVNQCGRSGKYNYGGTSMIISPFGEITQEGKDSFEILRTNIETSEVSRARRMLPVFDGRNHSLYHSVTTL